MIFKKENGFTLIELVVVIIILGIVAVTALSKFINFSSDARLAALQGAEGALRSSAQLIHATAQIRGVAKSTSYVDLDYNGNDITTRYGYFAYHPDFARAINDLNAVLEITIPDDWDFTFVPGVTQGATSSRMSPKGVNLVTNPAQIGQISRCYVEYILPTQIGELPTFNVDENC